MDDNTLCFEYLRKFVSIQTGVVILVLQDGRLAVVNGSGQYGSDQNGEHDEHLHFDWGFFGFFSSWYSLDGLLGNGVSGHSADHFYNAGATWRGVRARVAWEEQLSHIFLSTAPGISTVRRRNWQTTIKPKFIFEQQQRVFDSSGWWQNVLESYSWQTTSWLQISAERYQTDDARSDDDDDDDGPLDIYVSRCFI